MITDSVVYAIVCTECPDYYIGYTERGKARWRDHLYRLRHHTHDNPRLQKVFNKYGEDSLSLQVIAYVPNDDVFDAETDIIRHLYDDPCCMNVLCGTRTPDNRGRKVSLLERAKKRTALTNDNIDDALEVIEHRHDRTQLKKAERLAQQILNTYKKQMIQEYSNHYTTYVKPDRVCGNSFTIQHDDGRIYTGNSYAVAGRELGLNAQSLKSMVHKSTTRTTSNSVLKLKGWKVLDDAIHGKSFPETIAKKL